MDSEKFLIYFCIIMNIAFSLLDRVSQIVYYNITTFLDDTVKYTCLAFILVKTCSYFLMGNDVSQIEFEKKEMLILVSRKKS